MAKNKKNKAKGDEKPAPRPPSPPAQDPLSPPPAVTIQSEIPRHTSPEPQAHAWGTAVDPGGGWNAGGGAAWGNEANGHHGADGGAWPGMGHENAHNWTDPPNTLLQPPPNQQPAHLETIPEQYSEDNITYTGSFSDDYEDGSQYGQEFIPHGMTAAPAHSAMRSPALTATGHPQPLPETVPAAMKENAQTNKSSSASAAARKLEENKRGPTQPLPSNVVTPADQHAALRTHQLGGHTPMSSASAAAALYESSTNRNKIPKPPPPPAAKPPQPVNPPAPGKTTWMYPKLFTPNGHRAAPIPSDPSWIATGGNAWSNKHRATKSTSAAAGGAPNPNAGWPPQGQPQQGGWPQVDPRNPHQRIPATQFHGVHSPQRPKHQSYPGHPMQGGHNNEAEQWQAWGKPARAQGGGGAGHQAGGGQGHWGGGRGGGRGPTWSDGEDEDENEGLYDQWDHPRAESWGDGGQAWGMGQGHGQGMGQGHGQGMGHAQARGQGHGGQGQMDQQLAEQLRKMAMLQQLAMQGRGQSKEKVNDAANGWGQHAQGEWAQGAADWGNLKAGGGGAGNGWETGKAGGGGGWDNVKGDGWGAGAAGGKGDGWGDLKGDGWGNGKVDNWGAAGWNGSPMHSRHSADWSMHKQAKEAAGTRNAVSPEHRSQIYNSLLNNSALNQGQQPKNNSNMTTKQLQQHAAMVQAQLAATAAAGGVPKVQQQQQQHQHHKSKLHQSTKVWEADDGWGNVDSDEEGYGNRRVHFSPKESEVWGASPRSIPSKSIVAGIATTPLNISSNVRFVESKGAAFSFVSEAFFGNTRFARERIHWLFPVDKDPRVAAMHQWVKKMSYNLGTFGLFKFLESRERGALFLNVIFRMEDHPKEPAFDWLTFPNIQGTMDKNLQESVAFYDPARVVMVILYLPSQTGKSVAAWRVKIDVPDEARTKYKDYIPGIVKMLREPKDYVVMLDENPKPPKPPTKTQLRKSKTILKSGGKGTVKGVAVKSPTKVLPNGQIQQGKKKRKWWKFFLS